MSNTRCEYYNLLKVSTNCNVSNKNNYSYNSAHFQKQKNVKSPSILIYISWLFHFSEHNKNFQYKTHTSNLQKKSP